MSIDITYNYLIEDFYEKFPCNFDVDSRKDPDKTGETLYDDLKYLFFKNTNMKVESKKQPDKFCKGSFFYTLFINDGEFRLSSDYIGPSVYWAKELGIRDNKIIDYLKIARTIGGHILWPRGNGMTVNQARAGCSGFYDRIDWTLIAIDIFYKAIIINQGDEAYFISECKNILPIDVCNYRQYIDKFKKLYIALKNYKSWFEKLLTFNEFCNFFNLRGSFVDEQYNVNLLAPLFPILPQNYEAYIDNNIKAIKKRNSSLLD